MSYKVVYEFDPFEETSLNAPEKKSSRRDALKEIAEYVRDELLQYYGDGESPVSRGKWKSKLSSEYAKLKEEISGVDFANMELYGDMLDSLEYKITGNKIQIGWFGGEEGAKAYGHQTGYDGHPTIKKGPVRQLLPNEGERLRPDIREGMKQIAKEFIQED